VQFLNEEDAEYLESLSKTERAQKAASQKEAREQLAAFRKQQDEAEKAGLAGDQGNPTQEEGETTWAFNARKRKNQKEHEFIKGLKLRKTSSTGKAEAGVAKTAAIDSKRVVLVEKFGDETKDYTSKAHSPAKATQKPSATASGLGLGAYSSDEDD
jgi:type II secretory pathway pseudopilin PulG